MAGHSCTRKPTIMMPTYFIIHQLEVIRKAIQDLHVYLEKKTKDIEEAQETLRNAKHPWREAEFQAIGHSPSCSEKSEIYL